jgi:Synergist-CTERM protein sorting domain-containing protein
MARILWLGIWSLWILMLPQLSWATSPLTCPVFCTVYESYCLGPDNAIQSESECPDVPPGVAGTDMEVIACEFSLGDSTVEGTCGWSRLADYSSDDCVDYSDWPVERSPCEALDAEGTVVHGVCEGGCGGTGSHGDDGANALGAAAGCQAVGASQLLLMLLLPAFLRRRRE